MNRDKIFDRIKEKNPTSWKHLRAVEAAMRALAKRFGVEDREEYWGIVGLIHDADWDMVKDTDDPTHKRENFEKVLEGLDIPDELLDDALAHNHSDPNQTYPRDTSVRKAIYAVDELTGIIVGTALVRPSKKIADVKVKSVKKKMKDKTFCAKVDRSLIKSCETELDIELSEFIEITLNAMKEIGDELGL